MRSNLASFLGALVSLIVGYLVDPVIELGRAFLRTDYRDHRATLNHDCAARDLDAVPIAARVKAFVSRALDHDRFVGGAFTLGRSPAI